MTPHVCSFHFSFSSDTVSIFFFCIYIPLLMHSVSQIIHTFLSYFALLLIHSCCCCFLPSICPLCLSFTQLLKKIIFRSSTTTSKENQTKRRKKERHRSEEGKRIQRIYKRVGWIIFTLSVYNYIVYM